MRVLAVTPIHVGTDELARRQERYDRLSPSNIEVTLVDLPDIAPRSLNSDADVHSSDTYVAEVIKNSREGYDLVLPDCVLDPAFKPSDDEGIRGLLHQAVTSIASNGEPFGVIVRNEAIAKELRRRLVEYGMDSSLVDVQIMDLPFEAVTNHEMWNAAMTQAVIALGVRGARSVINGCSAIDVDEEDLGVRVVDPTQVALLRLAEESP
jgi:Asp/Glu/hydantoin racemase